MWLSTSFSSALNLSPHQVRSAVQPDETKIPLLGPRRHVLRLGAIQFRRRLKSLGRAEQQGRGNQTNQSNAFCDSDTLHGSLPTIQPRPLRWPYHWTRQV